MIEFEIEIDGKKMIAQSGQMVIDVADENHVYIPRFCYHKKLSVAANCRMCLVEVEKSAKPLPACATPVTAGMKVFTHTKKALEAQRAVMEFLLINHPLDCPICDQGGECELQDLAMGYGEDVSRFSEGKRAVFDEDIGPLVETEMTRCIHCTRCVRFGTEIAGMRELGATGRGENMRIGTYVKHAVQSEISGNIIDLCPVGALTSKPYRFTARAWEMLQHPSVAPHDCVGSNIYIHTRNQEYSGHRDVLRVVPKDNEAINETWISDRDRYSYEALHHEDKLAAPIMKINGVWVPVDWSVALNFVVEAVQKIQAANGNDAIAGLISPSATVEEQFLFQKILRGLGTHNIDHRIRHLDFSQQDKMPAAPKFEIPLDKISQQRAILLVGSDVRREQPIINLQIRKAFLDGAEISCVNMLDYDFNYELKNKKIVSSDQIEKTLMTILESVSGKNAKSADVENNIGSSLLKNENAIIFIGASAQQHPHAHNIQALCEKIAKLSGAKIAVLTEGANSAGAWLTGCVPHRSCETGQIMKPGDHAQSMFLQKKSAYFLFNVEPELDCANSAQALSALRDSDFVVCFSPFRGGLREEYANLIIPISTFAETGGTYINCEGLWQSFNAVGPAYAEARPGWKVLRVLGNLFELAGFDYECSNEIRDEVKLKIDSMRINQNSLSISLNDNEKLDIVALTEWPMYSTDSLTRRAKALQATTGAGYSAFGISPALAKKLKVSETDSISVTQNHQKLTLAWRIDERLPDNVVLIPAGLKETTAFGQAFVSAEIKVGK